MNSDKAEAWPHNLGVRNGRAPRLAVFGAGYVGGLLARRALAAGWRVAVLTRNPATAAQLAADGAEAVVAEIGDVERWRWHPAFDEGAERVAVTVSAGGGGVEGYRRSYVEGLRAVVEWGRSVPVGPLIYTSSTSVYPQDGGVRVTERDPVGGEAETTRALIEAEGVALTWSGRTSTILRLAGIYGPGRTYFLEQVRRGEVAGKPEAHLNLIHLVDIVAGMEAVWMRGGVKWRIFNLADSGEATRGEVAEWLAGRLGLPRPRFTGLPTGGRRAVTPDRIIDATKAREVLGWRPAYPTYRDGYGALLAGR